MLRACVQAPCHPAGPQLACTRCMQGRRGVLLALQKSANRRLADIRRGGRVIVADLHVARDLAEIRGAAPRIVRALEITAYHGAAHP